MTSAELHMHWIQLQVCKEIFKYSLTVTVKAPASVKIWVALNGKILAVWKKTQRTLHYKMSRKTEFISVAREHDPKWKITDESKNLNICWQ